jgi:hypothetical protein
MDGLAWELQCFNYTKASGTRSSENKHRAGMCKKSCSVFQKISLPNEGNQFIYEVREGLETWLSKLKTRRKGRRQEPAAGYWKMLNNQSFNVSARSYTISATQFRASGG